MGSDPSLFLSLSLSPSLTMTSRSLWLWIGVTSREEAVKPLSLLPPLSLSLSLFLPLSLSFTETLRALVLQERRCKLGVRWHPGGELARLQHASGCIDVSGLPVRASHLDGLDSLLSTVQLPRGTPVGSVGINNSTNAGLLAVRILGCAIPRYREEMQTYMNEMTMQVENKAAKLHEIGWDKYLESL